MHFAWYLNHFTNQFKQTGTDGSQQGEDLCLSVQQMFHFDLVYV